MSDVPATTDRHLGAAARLGSGRLARSIRQLALLPAIVVVIIAGSLISPAFLTTSNLLNVAQQSAALGAVVVALTFILLTGFMDLSLQSVYGLAPMVAAWLIVSISGQGLGTELPAVLGVPIALLIGGLIGAINGLFIIKGRFNAFIFTLAMLILLAGIQVGIVNGRTVYHLPPEFTWLGAASIFGVPVSVIVTVTIFIVAALFLRYHRTGRSIYAIGGNLEAARAAGIQVDRIRIGVFIVAGILAALAGVMTAGQVVAVTAAQGNNLIFSVFAAAVIGGIGLNGGRGSMIGALMGVVLLALVNNILVLSQLQTFWIDAADGAIIMIALVMLRVLGNKSE